MEKEISKGDLLLRWKQKENRKHVLSNIPKAPQGAKIPLSNGQRRLWFLHHLHRGNAFYNYSERYSFKGRVDTELLFKALEAACNRHESLRTTYHLVDGALYQAIAPKASLGITQHDFTHLERGEAEASAQRVMSTAAGHCFDLERPPVVLATLIKIDLTTHVLLLTLHHIATDKWSMGLLLEDFAAYYKAMVLERNLVKEPTVVQYADYAYWEQQQVVDPVQLAYWKDRLVGNLPFIALPTDFIRPDEPSFKGGTSPTFYFSRTLSAELLSLSKKMGVTPYVLFLSVYYVLLFRYSGQKDILIGSPVSNRDLKELEDIIGFFNNTVVLRTQLAAGMSFKELVEKVKQTALEAFSNKDVPFETLVKELKQERSLSTNPFFQVMFLYHTVPEVPSFGDDVIFEHGFFDAGVSKFDLTLYISEHNGMLSSTFEYSSDLFKATSVARFQEHFTNLLVGIVKGQDIAISKLPLLTEEERRFFQSQRFANVNVFETFSGIHDIFSSVAERFPDKIALSYLESHMTYGELDAKSTVLAKRIFDLAQKKNEIVGLCIERSLDMIVGMLAILKAGCAYLPIDPGYPAKRIDYVLKDAEVNLMVTASGLTHLFAALDIDSIYVDLPEAAVSSRHLELPEVDQGYLAYIIYTSGSTGTPKGVPISHRNIINSTSGRLEYYNENPEAFLLMSSISFDSSKAGIYWTLCTGGNLVIAEKRIEQDISKIEELVFRNKVTHTLMLPSLYSLLLEHANISRMDSLKVVVVAGEPCPPSLCTAHFQKLEPVALYNEYGPTEATVWCTAYKVEKERKMETVPLGKAVANAEIYLLDASLNRVPFGVIGEIYVGGIGLAGEYYKRPDLTREAYVQNPFGISSDEKLYRTGDLGKYHVDGTLEFLGRSDQQVKIRGHRIEISEIEKLISGYKGVGQAVVVAEAIGDTHSKRLVGYVASNANLDIKGLKDYLKERVPEYMVPGTIIPVGEIPKLPNGKVDKHSLKSIQKVEGSLNAEQLEEPKNVMEAKLLELWKDILQLEEIGTADNFFDLGGDSILSIQFIAQAKKEGILLSPNQLFDYQTITSLAAHLTLKESREVEWDYVVALRKSGTKKPLFCIHAGGGHIFFYNILTKYIDEDRPIYAIQASGAYEEQAVHETIEQMAVDYLRGMQEIQPQGPYNVLVYCFSVAVGHHIAKLLTGQGQVANLIIMDTMADQWNLNTPKRLKIRMKGFVKRFVNNPTQAIAGMLTDRWVYYKWKFSKSPNTPEQNKLIRLNANLGRICKVYDWYPVHANATIIITEKEEESINTEIVASWRGLLTGEVRVARTKGIHRNLFEEPDVEGVSRKIDEAAI